MNMTIDNNSSNSDVSNWIQYWRNSLADADLIQSVPSDSQVQKVIDNIPQPHIELIEKKWMLQGELPQSTTKKFFKESKEIHSGPETINILLAPIIARVKLSHGKSPKPGEVCLAPLWLKCKINRQGVLFPPDSEDQIPFWVRREHLEPTDSHAVFGKLDDSDTWLTSNAAKAVAGNWDGYLEAARQYLNSLCDSIVVINDLGYTMLKDQALIFNPTNSTQYTQKLHNAYSDLQQSKDGYPKLLRRFVSPSNGQNVAKHN